VTLTAAVPAGTAAGSYPVRATATAGDEVARAAGSVRVVGDTIAFNPGTDAEAAWLSDPDGTAFREVLRETADVRDLSNLRERSFDLGGAHTLYVRIGDARPENGWGGWLAGVRVQLSG
jgi:hypothetical protein